MTEILLRMLLGVTLGLALVLLLRRAAHRLFGAGPAFTLWLLPVALAVAPLLPGQLAPGAMAMLPVLTVTAQATSVASAATPIGGVEGLAALWLLGAALGTLRLVLHYWRLARALRDAPAAWTSMLSQAAPRLDPRRVRRHDAGPAVLWALPRSLILLPADFAERFGDAESRALVLQHELTHVRRADALWSLAMEVASALLWFHPLAWLARPRFRLDQELACDAAALRASPGRRANYARALLASVAVQPMPPLIPWLSQPQLKERIAMITRIPPGALRRRAGFLAGAALLAAGLYVAGGQSPVVAAAEGGSGTTPPAADVAFRNRHPPKYPAQAIKEGEQGNVLLDITVHATGAMTDIAVDPRGTTASQELQIAAIRAAQYWRFHPGSEHGKPIGGVIKVPIKFSLHVSHACHAGEAYAAALNRCVELQSVDAPR